MWSGLRLTIYEFHSWTHSVSVRRIFRFYEKSLDSDRHGDVLFMSVRQIDIYHPPLCFYFRWRWTKGKTKRYHEFIPWRNGWFFGFFLRYSALPTAASTLAPASSRSESPFRQWSCGQNRNIFRSILLVDFSSASFSKNGYIQQTVKKGRFRALRYTADFALFTLYTTKSLSGKCNKSLTSLFLK